MTYYIVSPDITWRVEGDSVLTYNRASTLVHQLNIECACLFRLCDGSREVPELVAAFTKETGREDLGPQIESFCQQLSELGILVAGERKA